MPPVPLGATIVPVARSSVTILVLDGGEGMIGMTGTVLTTSLSGR
jgi:hypothetical protein